MNRILIIQYFFKPITSNQSFRYERILEYLDANIKVDVLTSLHNGLDEEEHRENLNVYRVNNKFLKKKLDFKSIDSGTITKENRSNIKTIINSIARKIMWPDFAFLWILPTYLKGRKLVSLNKYDMIYTVSFPFSSHVVGMLLKLSKSDLKWTVDYIDPFSIIKSNENPANNVKLYKQLNRFVEMCINIKADRIFLLEEAYSRFIKLFPEVIKKITVIPPMVGIDQKKYNVTTPFKFSNSGINIVYTGTFYKSIRSPEQFLVLFMELVKKDPNIYLHIIGDVKDCDLIIDRFVKLLPKNIFLYGKVSREIAISYLKGADVLLNISNSSYSQLPGKVVEYLYIGKKILNFSQWHNNNSTAFFMKNGLPDQIFEIREGKYDIEEVLTYLYKDISFSVVNIDRFSPESIAKLYFQ